ncbi:PREDICTED: uncharacterized protein LOC109174494 [Ipomoea nil]|uniref:uncharacterized protein LOC109174494 n=1 Tax=Ipomoea nil TaxID=35883 RepID=UPI000900A5F1|nr:PREDICTED: uncharacterized protein LOC109174494 [Ipomoea nil]
MEIKVGRIHAERLRIKIGFEGLFYVDSVGVGGNLALLWRKNNTARLLSFSKNHVDIEVAIRDEVWRMTCFYGFPQRNRRREAWQLLSGLKGRSTLPWVVLGNFNDLLYQQEKRGGNPHPDDLLRGFGETLDNCGLIQLPMRTHQFTWEKGEGTDGWIEERLDKVLVTAPWTDIHGGPGEVVETAWQDGRDRGLLNCQQYCGGRLMQWGGDHWNKFGDHIKQLRNEQDALRHRRDSTALVEFRRIEVMLGQVEVQEDVFWRQRAKQHWLRGADANTKFYHKYASAHKRKNYISRLKNDVGDWVEGDNMKRVILDYYAAIFASSESVCEDPMFDDFSPRVTHEQNIALLRPYESDEVGSTLFAMFPDKALGPDGMNSDFYQQFWDINMPETVADMRPIALSNVLYRIMAKVIANRMKSLMGDIISESRSAFIPRRLITDNILIAAEVGHYLNRKQCGIIGWGALKLDMAKACDRMEWQFMRRMLEEACVLKECLKRYEELSGQKVNYHKSNIRFSKNTREEDREMVAECLQVDQAPNFGKYLGLPSFIGRNKRVVFSYIEDKVKQRIGSWNKKLLSQRTMNRYWWGSGGERGIHWKAWDKLCVPMKFGGLGFKDLKSFNLAMLGKQACRFLTNPSSLVAKVYKARYFPATSFIDAKVGSCPSYAWRSIMAAHDMVVAGTDMPEELRHAKVAGLIDDQTNMWDPHILLDLFITEDVNRILGIPVSPGYDESWCPKMEDFSVESSLPVTNIITDSFPAWLTAALAILTKEQSGVLVAVLYHLWQSRNSAMWEKTLPHPAGLWRRASAAMNSYRQANHRPPLSAPHEPDIGVHVRPRCYVDAGYRHATGEATFGAVLLLSDGTFMAVQNGRLPTCFSPFMAETLACKEALSWLLEWNIMDVDLLTDCLQLRNAMRQESTIIMSYAGVTVDQCRSMVASFTYCSLSYVSRQVNSSAHVLASLAFSQDQFMLWDSIPHDSIAALLH